MDQQDICLNREDVSADNHVAAVVVTYCPDLNALNLVLSSVGLQVGYVIIVDNGVGSFFSKLRCQKHAYTLHCHAMGENKGLASAQNVGIDQAQSIGASHVLLLDQDSVPSFDMVSKLLVALDRLTLAGQRVAAVGPSYTDMAQGDLKPFVRVRYWNVIRFQCAPCDEVVQVDHLIASGSLIPMSALDAIGPMREELFIDYVDTEWSLRAWRLGYHSYGVCGATMQHGLGDRPFRLFGRYIPIHSPLRHYYLFRNTLWLYRQDWIPWTWKVATARRVFLKFLFFSLVPKDRLGQVRMMLRGMRDGLRGRMGPYVP